MDGRELQCIEVEKDLGFFVDKDKPGHADSEKKGIMLSII